MITSFNYQGTEIKFEVNNQQDYLQKFWLRGTFYELGMLQFIQARWQDRAMDEKITFIDIGACIGNHTIFFSKVIGAKVIAFEPWPKNVELIKINKNLNEVAYDVDVWSYAAGDRDGYVTMKADKTGNSGMHRISNNGEISVPIRRLDDLLWDPCKESYPPVHLIKIDVEGYNMPVLRGLKWIISLYYHPEIFIECATQDELNEVEGFLLPLGYKRWPNSFNATPTYFFYFPG
jgi:FkbM family methyltransferase